MLIVQKKNKSKYESFKRCNVCKSKKLKNFLSLGKHTPADTFVNKKDINIKIEDIDLDCVFCKKCFNIQLKRTVNQNLKYNKLEYSYSSSNSKKSMKYLDEYSNIIKKYSKIENKKILEIGANDGYLLKKFKNKKNKLYSCDASTYWSNKLKIQKIFSINKIFENLSKSFIKKNQSSFNLIIANNVVNHSHNIRLFFKNLEYLIHERGLIFIEVPYSKWMIENKKFELIYLEHINYFNIKSLKKLCDDRKLKIKKIMFTNYHGKMIRIIISKEKSDFNYHKIISKENNYFRNLKNLMEFKKNIYERKIKFLKKIDMILKNKSKIVAIGASAKTSSLLNFFNLNKNKISFITDNSPQKVGKFIPNKKIPIKKDEFLSKINKPYIFFSTWNISDFVRDKILKINNKIKIIKY